MRFLAALAACSTAMMTPPGSIACCRKSTSTWRYVCRLGCGRATCSTDRDQTAMMKPHHGIVNASWIARQLLAALAANKTATMTAHYGMVFAGWTAAQLLAALAAGSSGAKEAEPYWPSPHQQHSPGAGRAPLHSLACHVQGCALLQAPLLCQVCLSTSNKLMGQDSVTLLPCCSLHSGC